MMDNEVLVERLNLAGSRSPMAILNRIKERAKADEEEKKRLQEVYNQQSITDNICYFMWLKENNISDFEFDVEWQHISFSFINPTDATAFKLRWT